MLRGAWKHPAIVDGRIRGGIVDVPKNPNLGIEKYFTAKYSTSILTRNDNSGG
jgi:hypothetical protein